MSTDGEAERVRDRESPKSVTHLTAQSSMYLFVRRVGVLALSFVSTMVVTRKLGPSSYGDLQSALAMWGLLLTFCDFGVSMALGREMAKYPERQPALLRATFWAQGAWSVCVSLFMATLALLTGAIDSQHTQLLLVLAPSVLFAAFASGKSIFLVRYQLAYTVMVDLVTTVLQVALSIALASTGFGPIALAVVIAACSILNSAWIGWAAHRRSGTIGVEGWRPSVRALLKAAIPLGAMSLLSRIYLNIDLVILGFMGVPLEVGHYAAAVKVVTLVNTLPGLLVNAALPGVSAHIEDEVAAGALLARLLHWMAAFALPMFIALALYAKPIALVLFGESYIAATSLMVVLALAGLIGTVSQFFSVTLIASMKLRPLLVQNIIATVFNVALNVALIPVFGALACAWLTVGTEAIVCVGSAFTLFSTMEFRFAAPEAIKATRVVVGATLLAGVGFAVNTVVSMTVFAVSLIAGLLWFESWPTEFLPNRLVRRGNS